MGSVFGTPGEVMMTTQSGGRAIRGLATVALLKANFDAGRDHLSMFEPFVLDSLASMTADSADAETVRQAVSDRHGLVMPHSVIQTLLNRVVREGHLRREGGRYFFTSNRVEQSDIVRDREKIERRQQQLANALCSRAEELGLQVATAEDALILILEFLERYLVAVVLDEASSVRAAIGPAPGEDDARSTRITATARFILEVVAEDGTLAEILQEILEGFVLQNALLLKDIASTSRRFTNLHVYLDSGVLFAALGCYGNAERSAVTELFGLLRDTGASLNVFNKTIDEIQHILRVFESRIGTSQGRDSLFPTELTRYFLTNRYSPSDIAQLAALLNRDLRAFGITVRDIPAHEVAYTLDEGSLGSKLASRAGEETAPRVVHDVDCVAGVLTLRRGRTSESLDHIGPIFVTRSGWTAKEVSRWYESEGGAGIPPIIDIRLLSNIAWLKRPASASRLKVHELVALCTAALRPTRAAWRSFITHLRRLRESGEISDDETASILVSSFTDRMIADDLGPDDPDSQSISEVIDRVLATYRDEADRKLLTATTSLEQHQAEVQRLRMRLERLSRTAGRFASWLLAIALTIVFILGTVISVISGFTGSQLHAWALALAILPLSIGGLFGLLTGFHIRGWQRVVEEVITRRVRAVLIDHA